MHCQCDLCKHLPPLPAAPIQVLDTSRVHHNLTSNREVRLTVDFIGRETHNLTISWFHNSLALAATDPRIINTFDAALGRGRTELRFPETRRSDIGLYRVVLHSQLGTGTEQFSSQQEVTFQIDITGRLNTMCQRLLL